MMVDIKPILIPRHKRRILPGISGQTREEKIF